MKSKIILSELPVLMVILSILQICLIIVQVAYSVLIFTNTITSDGLYEGGYIVFIIIAVFLLNLFILWHVLRTLKNSYALIHDQKETIKNIEALNHRIRAQRHDFLNHIQVLYGMVEVEAYPELRQYLHKLYGDIETANSFLKTQSVAVNALLQAKYSYAHQRGIPFHLDISTRLADMPISEWDMCKLLGNLIDNAIHATESHPGEKMVQVRLTETLDGFTLAVANNGPPILPENITRLFEPGFTTRQHKGEGMGLFIVKQIIDTHHGTIQVNSEQSWTEFTVFIPKNKPAYPTQ